MADWVPTASARSRWTVPAAVAVVLVPLFVVLVRLVGHDHAAMNGDDALIELRTRDVFSHHPPLLGSYQRFGWNQPGPLYFYLLAVPYRIFGQSFSAVQISVLVLNALAAITVVLVLRRLHGDAAALWSALLISIALHAMSVRTLTDPWEPSISVMLLVALVVLAYDASTGTVGSWFAAAFVGSLLAQAYASVTTIAIGVTLFGVAMGAVRRYRSEPRRPVLKPLLFVVAGTLIVWLPVFYEEVRRTPGNLTAMFRYFTDTRDTLGGRSALGAFRLQSGFGAPWITNHVPKVAFTTHVDVHAGPVIPFALVAFLVAVFVAWRKRNWQLLQFAALVATFGVLGVASLRTLTLPFFMWILTPYNAWGLLVWLVVGVVVVVTWRRVGAALGAASAIGVLVVVPFTLGAAIHAHLGPDRGPAALDAAAARVAPTLRATAGEVLVRSEVPGQLLTADGYGRDETAVALATRGIPIVVEADGANRFGPERAHPERARYELRLQTGDQPMPPGFRELTRADPLGADRTIRDELVAEMTTRCTDVNGRAAPTDPAASLEWLESCSTRDPNARRTLRLLADRYDDLPVVSFRFGPVESKP